MQTMVRKKGQLKIQQMALMLIALTVLFALVGMFFLGIKISQLKRTSLDIQQQEAIFLASKLVNSPEFYCGESFGTLKGSCLDFDKVMALKLNINKYSQLWAVDNIEIRILDNETEKACTSGNYPNCNSIKLLSQNSTGFDASTFVSICRKEKRDFEEIYNICEIGKLSVRYAGNE